VGVAERSGTKEPYASCRSGCWLTPDVDWAFAISNMEPRETVEETDSKEEVRVRVRGRLELFAGHISCKAGEYPPNPTLRIARELTG
jgi:hypothetical protein